MSRTTGLKAYNGKRLFKDYTRRSTMKYDPATVTFEQAIADIDTSWNENGLLTRLDRVLALAKKGYDKTEVKDQLKEWITDFCPWKDLQRELLRAYIPSK